MTTSARGVQLRRRNDPGTRELAFGEAYFLLKYVNRCTGRVEWLWNSRDGVTPFTLHDELDKPEDRGPDYGAKLSEQDRKDIKGLAGMMTHVDWFEDVFLPNFVPAVGSRVFVDYGALPDEARSAIRAQWIANAEARKAADSNLRGHPIPPDTDEAWGMKPGSPWVLVVDEPLRKQFEELAFNNPFEPPPRRTILMPPSGAMGHA